MEVLGQLVTLPFDLKHFGTFYFMGLLGRYLGILYFFRDIMDGE